MNLITGATGLVGAHVALQLLQAKQPVAAIKRSSSDVSKTKNLFSYYTNEPDLLFNQIKWIDADVSDIYSLLDALDGITTVYHCAGFVSFDDKKDGKQLQKINAEGTANMVNACLEKKNVVLCHVSSIATLQNPDITSNINESLIWKSSPTASQYAISKYNGEREVWRGIEEGLQAVIVNPSIILGPGFWNQSSGKLFSDAVKRGSFYTDGGSAFVDARDVANCMIQLTQKQLLGKRYILSEGNYAFKDITTRILKEFDSKAPSIHAGKALLKIGQWLDGLATLFTGKERLLTNNIVNSLVETTTYNNQRIVETLNYQFIPLNDSIQFICNAFTNDSKK